MKLKVKPLSILLASVSVLLSCTPQPVLFSRSPLRFFTQNRHFELQKPEVISIPSPNHNDRPEDTPVSAVVLHHTATASDAQSVGKFFANPSAGVSAHYTIDRTGYIVQSVEDDKRSWHAGVSEFEGQPNVNNFSIGIEICNVGDSLEPYPDAQYDSVIRLVTWLVKTHQISLVRITRHRDVAIPSGRKIDTSDNFSVQRVLDGVQALLAGEYHPSPAPPVENPVNYPPQRTVRISTPMSMKAVAEKYLDHEVRWQEIKHLNPELNPDYIPAGTLIRIPTDYRFFGK